MDTTATTPLPTEELLKRAEENGYELVDGVLVEKPVGAKSSWIESRLLRRLGAHVEDRRLGLVFNSECGYQITPGKPKQVRKPDISFVPRGRIPDDDPPRWEPQGPARPGRRGRLVQRPGRRHRGAGA